MIIMIPLMQLMLFFFPSIPTSRSAYGCVDAGEHRPVAFDPGRARRRGCFRVAGLPHSQTYLNELLGSRGPVSDRGPRNSSARCSAGTAGDAGDHRHHRPVASGTALGTLDIVLQQHSS